MSSPPIRIVVIEDDRAVCKRIVRVLERSSAIVLAAVFHDAESAIEGLLVERMDADVVVVDLMLPGMNGVEAIDRLTKDRAELETVVLTTIEDDAMVFAALEAGASGYIVKSQGLDALATSILSLLSGGSPMSPTIARRLIERFRGAPPEKARAPVPAAASGPEEHASVTARESEVLTRLARGVSYAAIAAELDIGTGTVQSHVKAIYKKLGIHSRAEAAREVYRRRLR